MPENATAEAEPPSARPTYLFVAAGVTAFVFALILTVVLGVMRLPRETAGVISIVAWLTPLVLFAWAGLRALGSMLLALVEKQREVPWGGFMTAGALSFLGFVMTGMMMAGFSRGRQLRRNGKLLLASLKEDPSWSTVPLQPVVPDAFRAPLAEQWRQNGRTEHASVAAFAQLTLDLMSLGAPASLLASAQRDALDEVRHAELCFSLAASLDGRAQGPAPFPQAATKRRVPAVRELALAQLAVDSLVEGALLEGFSARLIAKLVTGCEDPATARLLTELASDEGRHSRHGWDVVEWCLSEGGLAVRQALRGALNALPMQSKTTALTVDLNLERYGIAGPALEQRTYLETRAYVVERLTPLTQTALAA